MPARWHMLDFLPADAQWCIAKASQTSPDAPRFSVFGIGRERYETVIREAEARGIQVWIATVGFRHGRNIRRRQADMQSGQALVLDIDVGEGRLHADAQSAAREILERIKTGDMLRPTALVSSGYGLHLWYRLQTALPIQDWRRLAKAWKDYHSRFKALAGDTSRWADGGLLRPFGTTNRKHGQTRPVRVVAEADDYSVDYIRNWLEAQGQPLPAEARRKSSTAPTTATSFLTNRPSIVDVVKGCALLTHYHRNLQSSASEPAWWAALAVSSFTREGIKAAHALSVGYPGYSREETEDKYTTIVRAWQDHGPPGCQVLRERILGSDRITGSPCAGCPMASPARNRGMVANPFNRLLIDETQTAPILGKLVAQTSTQTFVETGEEIEAVKQAGFTPDFISEPGVQENASVWFDPETNTVYAEGQPVASPAWWVSFRCAATPSGMPGTTEIAVRWDKVHHYTVLSTAFSDMNQLCRMLASLQIPAPPADARVRKALWNYAIRTSSAVTPVARRSVMGYDEKTQLFAVGNLAVDCSGNLLPMRLADDAAQEAAYYQAKGTLKGALTHLHVYAEHGKNTARFVVGLGFAATLMHLTTSHGAIVHLHGAGGYGKSSMLAFVAGLFGSPTAAQISGAAGDTAKAVASKIAARRHLPVCYDEVTFSTPEEVGELSFAFTQGRINAGRQRTGVLRPEAPLWSTIMLTSANGSLHRLFNVVCETTDAQRRRIFELEVTEPIAVRNLQSVRDLGAENHGVLGVAWLQHLMRNRERLREAVRSTFDELLSHPNHRVPLELYTRIASVNLVVFRELTALGWWRCAEAPEAIVEEVWTKAVEAYDGVKVDVMAILASYIAENVGGIITRTEGVMSPLVMPFQRGIMGRIDQYRDGARRVSLPLIPLQQYFHSRFGRKSRFDQFLKRLADDPDFPLVRGPDSGRPWVTKVDMRSEDGVSYGVSTSQEAVECLVFMTRRAHSTNVLKFSHPSQSHLETDKTKSASAS